MTGRFAPGWRGGKGNPHALAVARFRSTVLDTVTEGDLLAVVARLVECAKAGEPWAVRELLDRTLGKVAQVVGVAGPGDDADTVLTILPPRVIGDAVPSVRVVVE